MQLLRDRVTPVLVLLTCIVFLGNATSALALTYNGEEIEVMSMIEGDTLEVMNMDSGPVAPMGVSSQIVEVTSQTAIMLNNVPTSDWTCGCSATSAGMIFGYYDRTGYSNMYTGPCNGGVAPMTDLGNQCSIIVTEKGFDGRDANTPGHVDDYWTGYNNSGPDPWESGGVEHTWGDCTADYMGTNQWKWDNDLNGSIDSNTDGSTSLWSYSSGTKLYDFTPSSSYGTPRTALCHGMRLFAESRGYEVLENYTQKVDAVATGGFSFDDYMNEIDSGCPVMIQVTGHSMVGVGYDESTQKVYLHDTWGDYVAEMTWGGSYSGMAHQAVTVIHLAAVPEPSSIALLFTGIIGLCALLRRQKR